MLSKKVCILLLVAFLAGAAIWVVAQQDQPLTNADVVKMVKSGLPASVIVNAIQANPTNFDVSANGLIALQKASVPQTVMDAMISAASKKRSAASGGEAAAPAPAATSSALPGGGHLSVSVTQGGKGDLTREKTQLAQTKTKASSLGGLAGDSAVNQGFQQGMNVAAWQA